MKLCPSSDGFDIEQTSAEEIIYTVDWPARGLPAGVTIAGQTLVATGGLVLTDEAITSDNTTVTFTLSGVPYPSFNTITNTVTLSDGEVWQVSLSVKGLEVRPV